MKPMKETVRIAHGRPLSLLLRDGQDNNVAHEVRRYRIVIPL
jgi:hypothetical protein